MLHYTQSYVLIGYKTCCKMNAEKGVKKKKKIWASRVR